MKLLTSLAMLLFISSPSFAHYILISYNRHAEQARYIQHRLQHHYQIPASLIRMDQRPSPCLRKKKQTAAHLCIKDSNKELVIVYRNREILEKSYSFFLGRLP